MSEKDSRKPKTLNPKPKALSQALKLLTAGCGRVFGTWRSFGLCPRAWGFKGLGA